MKEAVGCLHHDTMAPTLERGFELQYCSHLCIWLCLQVQATILCLEKFNLLSDLFFIFTRKNHATGKNKGSLEPMQIIAPFSIGTLLQSA